MNTDDARALLDRLFHRIAPDVDLAAIDSQALLQEEIDIDSMDFLNLVTALHDEAGIDVPEHDYPKLATLDGFVSYIANAAT